MFVAVFDADSTVCVVATLTSGHTEGHLWHREARFECEVRLGWPATCAVNGRPRAWTVTHRRADVLDELRWWALYQLWDTELIETEDTWQLDWGRGEDAPEYRRCVREIDAIELLISDHVWRTRDREASERVHGMDDDTAFFAYTALLDHEHSSSRACNRIAQMIAVCPNVFTLASVAAPSGHARREIVEGIQRGEKLASLIRNALAIPLAEGRTGMPLNSQAVALVHYLPLRSFDDLMSVLQAPGIDVNDLLVAGKRADDWTRYVAEWGHRAHRVVGQDQRRRLGGFFSRHGLELYDASCMPDEVIDWIERATDVGAPDRSSSPRRVHAAIQHWHATLWTHTEYPAETCLAPGPKQVKVSGIEAVPIETVGALVAEGTRMAHCVASLAAAAVAGSYIVYSADVLDVSMTIALGLACNSWTLIEASGFANQRPTVDQLAVIWRWVEGLR